MDRVQSNSTDVYRVYFTLRESICTGVFPFCSITSHSEHMKNPRRSPRVAKSPDAYHHGNLREAAIGVALRLVAQGGNDALALRDVASALSVTPMAIYRHFENRAALLAAVRARGHATLYDLHKRVSANHTDPVDRLAATLRAFIDFAEQNPRLFMLLYDPEVVHADNNIESAEAPAYWSIGALLREAMPSATDHDVRLREITLWSTVFGYATIRVYGLLQDYMLEGLHASELGEAVVQSALTGLK